MNYLIQKMDNYVINYCFENERAWKRVKPWWFTCKISEAIAWSVFNYNKKYGYPPSLSLVTTLIDYKRSKVTIEEVNGFLRSTQIDHRLMADLFLTFETYGMLWDIIVKHHEKNIDQEDFKALRSIVETLKKDPLVSIMDYQTILNKWKKWNGTRVLNNTM